MPSSATVGSAPATRAEKVGKTREGSSAGSTRTGTAGGEVRAGGIDVARIDRRALAGGAVHHPLRHHREHFARQDAQRRREGSETPFSAARARARQPPPRPRRHCLRPPYGYSPLLSAHLPPHALSFACASPSEGQVSEEAKLGKSIAFFLLLDL